MAAEALEQALDRLLTATTPQQGDVRMALEAGKELSVAAVDAGEDAIGDVLNRLAAQLLVPEVEHPSLLAIACADLVEQGGTASIVVDCVLTKFIDVIQQSRRFVEQCRSLTQQAGRDCPDAEAIEHMAQLVADEHPDLGWAWRGLPYYANAAAAILDRTKEAADVAREHTDLLDECQSLVEIDEQQTLDSVRSFLTVLQVYSDFQLALRVITDADAPGSLSYSALSTIEFDAEKLDKDVRAEALRELAWAMRSPNYPFPVLLTRASELLVRHGGDPAIVINAFLDRFSDSVEQAYRFVQLCMQHPERPRDVDPDDHAAIIEAVYPDLRESEPNLAIAWSGLAPMASSLVSLLITNGALRAKTREHPELMAHIERIAGVNENNALRPVRLVHKVAQSSDTELRLMLKR